MKFCRPARIALCFTEFATNIDEKMSRLNAILNRYISEKVTLRQDETSEALDFCWPVVEKIFEYVKLKDSRFAAMEIEGKGSYYERCKVGEPDEFDLMLFIKDLELDGDPNSDTEDDEMSAEPPTGRYIYLSSLIT